MRNLFAFMLVMFGFSAISSAQETKIGIISGQVLSDDKPVNAATISVFKNIDSSLVKMGVTEKNGKFEIGNIKDGSYYLVISAVGYKPFNSNLFSLDEKNQNYSLPAVSIVAIPKTMDAVVVTAIAKKPLIEQKLDRLIVNVDASPINAGTTALEVLEKSPGILVDKDGNISLRGKSGVMIMMDGKPTYLSSQDLTNLLRSMPSSQLEQIEIMTNPPAKYDAAGNSGVINLKTKKNKANGFNGSATVGAGYSGNPRANNSLNLNYKTGKFNLFANYSYNYYKGVQELSLTRKFPDTVFQQVSNMLPQRQTHNYKLGADYFAGKNTTVGIVLTGFENPSKFRNDNVTLIQDNMGNIVTRTEAHNKNNDNFTNKGVNINFRQVLDTTGKELTADVDYLSYNSSSQQNFNNLFFDNNGSKKQQDELLMGDLPSDIKIYSAKVDYAHPLQKGAKFEAGLKTSFVNTDNNALYSNFINNQWVKDAGRSNHFIYKENINAAYVNFNKQFGKKWSGQFGLRVENTISKGNQVTTGEVFTRDYTELFPTAYIGYKANDKNQFSLNYGRRIGRPDYQSMNPFFYFLDKYTYEVGNPYLKPQFSHNIELSHSFNDFLFTTISYSQTNDILQQVLEQIDSLNTTYIKESNIANQKNLSLSVSANIPVTKWWKANIYTNVFHNQYKGFVNKGNINVDGTSYMANISNQFTFKKGWSAEVSGFYRSQAIEGIFVAKSMGGLNLGVSKQVLKNKGSVKLSIRDVLYTQQFRGYSRFQNIDVTVANRRDSRIVNLSFSYRFGKGKPTQQRKKGGAGDEQDRVKVGNN